jgi:hypothetical protein
MADLEELTEEEIKKIKELYPPFVAKKMIELTDEINNRKRTQITEFLTLINSIWKLSNKSYQKEFWNKHGQWGDNYMETMETFLGDAEGVLEATGDEEIEMTANQREMLQKLYDMADFFTRDRETPGSDYGENDEAIINDPKWQKIGEYAKLVYEELSGDDLDEWEKQKNKGNRKC